MSPWLMFVIGLGSFFVAILGAIVTIKKLGPEVNKLQVDTSTNLVAMAKENAEMHRTDAAELRLRNEALDNRLTEAMRQLGAAQADIAELQRKTRDIERLTIENMQLRREKATAVAERNDAIQETQGLRRQVLELEREVDLLKRARPPV